MYVHVLVCQTSPVPMLLLHADAHDTYIRGMSELCLIIGLQDKWRLIQLDSFFCKRPFFANKKKFCESFANPTLIFRWGLMLKYFAFLVKKKDKLSRTQMKTLRGLLLEPWRPLQWTISIWTFGSTNIDNQVHLRPISTQTCL